MRAALLGLHHLPAIALIDGNRLPPALPCPARAIVGGDGIEPAISAASNLANIARDPHMEALDAHYPRYRFFHPQGYPTAPHLDASRPFCPLPPTPPTYPPPRSPPRCGC